MPPADQIKRTQHRHLSLLSVASSLVITSLGTSGQALGQAMPAPPRVEASGGLVFQSQGGGTPNTVTGYLLAPLSQGAQGQVLFLDVAANLNLGGAFTPDGDVSAGASTRLGYRWLSGDQRWMYGFNAGIDTRQAYNNYAFQAGVGAEALSRNVELRLNGYIPFANQAALYQTGYTNAYLRNNQLILDGWNRYVVSLGGTNLEAGVPLARWNNNSLWLYASYYYLDGDYVNGTSGVRGRSELRLGNQLAIGATVSYDSIFDTQATGYVRYGAKPLAGSAQDAVDAAERNFLALRGLPMQRDVDLRMVSAQQNLPNSVATNPGNGGANWVVRCTGTTTNTGTASVSCANPTLDALLAAAGPGDVLLVGGGASSDLGGKTLRLAVGTSLTGSGSAPTLATQFGAVNLNPVFGSGVGAQPAFNDGIISIGSNTTIAGFNFTNTSITNYSTSNVLIANNTFSGSYSPTPGLLTYNQNALPTIALTGVSNVTIASNTFTNPNVQSYTATTGDGGASVCDESGSGAYSTNICLSGNAIRIGPSNTGIASSNITISNNTIAGALDEAIRLDNVNGSVSINGNTISGMRNGPDSNMQAAIFIRQWTGNSQITVENNTIIDNEAGINAIANTATVASGAFSNIGFKNVVDPLEVGLCRGNLTFSNRAGDKYGDDFGGFNCSQAAPASMTYTARNNTLLPSANSTSFDEDGIDFNVGSYGIFTAIVENNTVDIKSSTNNAFTADFRGYNIINLYLLNNILASTNEPISIEAGTLPGLTSYSGAGGTIRISGNTLRNTSAVEQLIELTSVARNPSSLYSPSPVITPIFNIAIENPSYNSDNIDFSKQDFDIPFNVDFPLFYVNGVLQE